MSAPAHREDLPPIASFRVLVTGGRDYADAALVELELRAAVEVHLGPGYDPARVVLVHGDVSGLDRLVAAAARRLGFQVEPHPAAWISPCRATCPPHRRRRRDGTDYCPAAGVHRNAQMVSLGADFALVFPGAVVRPTALGASVRPASKSTRSANSPRRTATDDRLRAAQCDIT
ncbi:MAG: SLOG family protein [Actinomycetota bacterium]|jgi:hypothetical protein|nr:SLOG family protein [Actinomycetota bacterium]MDA8356930.1 SLOG family protein [Actinomycetota bacterium]